jgi:hypothetical protein
VSLGFRRGTGSREIFHARLPPRLGRVGIISRRRQFDRRHAISGAGDYTNRRSASARLIPVHLPIQPTRHPTVSFNTSAHDVLGKLATHCVCLLFESSNSPMRSKSTELICAFDCMKLVLSPTTAEALMKAEISYTRLTGQFWHSQFILGKVPASVVGLHTLSLRAPRMLTGARFRQSNVSKWPTAAVR